MGMTTHEIRETFLTYFEERDHLRLPSASLVPAASDATVLLTTAGMHPLVPYFRGEEKPPNVRMASEGRPMPSREVPMRYRLAALSSPSWSTVLRRLTQSSKRSFS